MNDVLSIPCDRVKDGPALWESGGGKRNTGSAQIIATQTGKKKKPTYIVRSGERANKQHAKIAVKEGDVVINASRSRENINITISIITGFSCLDDGTPAFAKLQFISNFSDGEWSDAFRAATFADAVDAAKEKVMCYHCKEPHFIDVTEKEATHVA